MKEKKFHLYLIFALGSLLLMACSSKKNSIANQKDEPAQFPDQETQEKLSQSFDRDAEGQSNFSNYIKFKTKNLSPVVCVDNKHEKIRFWSLSKNGEKQNPFFMVIQNKNIHHLCAALPDANADYNFKLEAYGRNGIYECELTVKAGQDVLINSDHHSLVCSNVKGQRKKI